MCPRLIIPPPRFRCHAPSIRLDAEPPCIELLFEEHDASRRKIFPE